MNEITFVLMTCGELTEAECLRSTEAFRARFEFAEVRNVSPQIVALNQMIDSVRTPYFVALDADMVLEPDAGDRLYNALDAHQNDNRWHSILFPLLDTLTGQRILALKLMRSAAMKAHPFRDGPTPDVEHYQRLTDAGYTCVHDYLEGPVIGRHVVRGHHFCYHKYRDVYQTFRAYQFQWDCGVFLVEGGLREQAKAHFDYFLYRYIETGDPDYLSCIAGMVDGILSPLKHGSKDLLTTSYQVEPVRAVDAFWNWYMTPWLRPETVMF